MENIFYILIVINLICLIFNINIELFDFDLNVSTIPHKKKKFMFMEWKFIYTNYAWDKKNLNY